MRMDYLTTVGACEYLLSRHGIRMSIDGMRKHLQRGRISSKRYSNRGAHFLTRGSLDAYARSL